MPREKRSSCPISFALDLFGDKWSLLILRDIIFKNKKSYNDFLASEESISTNILAERLTRLKADGFIKGHADKSDKKKTLYAPTEKALDLIPMILEIIEWSAKHDSNTAAPKEFLQRLKKNRKQLAQMVRSKFKR